MKLRWIWILLTIGLVLCGRGAHRFDTASPSTPAPDPDHGAFHAEEVTVDTGAVTRNGNWNMYRSIGEYLVQRGIAVMLYDKRGVGDSTGDWESETFDERAQDVAALVAYLQGRAGIDPNQIGLIGHSQGAYIAPLVVAKYSHDVKFVVMRAGSGQKVWDQTLTNEHAESLGNGLPESEVNEKAGDLES